MAKGFAFPTVLYKAFPCREYAERFCSGHVRFSTLRYYRESEDGARADRTEGIGLVKRNRDEAGAEAAEKISDSRGVEKLRVEAPDRECFICCFSHAEHENLCSLPARFGRFYVKVNSPERLFMDLQSAIRKDQTLRRKPPKLEAGAVRYDKDRYVGDLSNPDEIRALPWLQKPAYYAEENEYRIHFRCSDGLLGPCNNHTISIAKELDYCELLERRC